MAEAVLVEPGAACVSAASLTPQIEAWLGSGRVDAELTVVVRGSPTEPRDVSIEIQRGGRPIGQRRFYPSPLVCAQLEATLALAVAMALKVSLRDEVLDTLGEASSPRDQASLGLLVRAGDAQLPSFSLGAGIAAAQAFGDRFALRAEAFADAARNATFDGAIGKFHTLLLSAQLSGCALFPIAQAWRVRACLGLALGALHARGRGYQESRRDWLAWIAASNSVALSVRLSGHWWLDVPGSLVIPLTKLTFVVQHEDGSVAAAQALPRLGFTLGLGPQYHF